LKQRQQQADAASCAVPDCTDPSHAHGHSHAHSHADDHGHDHGHTHAHGTTAAEKYGIDTFVYSRRRPFHPKKLQDLIAFLPVKNAQRDNWIDHIPADGWSLTKLLEGRLYVFEKANELAILHTIVRSKGFVWIANHPNSAFHWSQAGAHLALNPLGMWWAATSLDVWPDAGDNASGEVGKLLEEFDLSSRWGDRRQELVFIGIGMLRGEIEALFDACLLTDDEMQQLDDFMLDQPNAVVVKDCDTSQATPFGRMVHERAE